MQGSQQASRRRPGGRPLYRARLEVGQPVPHWPRWRPRGGHREARALARRSASSLARARRASRLRSRLLLRAAAMPRRSGAAARERDARRTHRVVARREGSGVKRESPAGTGLRRCGPERAPAGSPVSRSPEVSSHVTFFRRGGRTGGRFDPVRPHGCSNAAARRGRAAPSSPSRARPSH